MKGAIVHSHKFERVIISRCSILIITILFLISLRASAHAFSFDIGKLSSDLAHYKEKTAKIGKNIETPIDINPFFVMYLSENQSSATSILSFILENPPKLPIVKRLEDFNQRRIQLKDRLMEIIDPSSKEWEYFQKENKAWHDYLSPYLTDIFIRNLVVSKKLYELKYFDEDDPKEANMIEGWLNGTFGYTQYKDEETWYRQNGISKWEISLRVEPLVLVQHDNHPGVLLASGILYNFFPMVSQSDGKPFQVTTKDNFWSKYLKRTGFKVGAGAIFDDPQTKFLTGLGIQIRAWSCWGVYSTGDSRFSVAVSLSDWDWAKNLLPFFN